MVSSIKHKQSISWTFLNGATAISAKEMPKNHTDKERFGAALSCSQTGILTLLFPRKRRRSSPSPFISHRVLEAVASWILKSLMPIIGGSCVVPPKRLLPQIIFCSCVIKTTLSCEGWHIASLSCEGVISI